MAFHGDEAFSVFGFEEEASKKAEKGITSKPEFTRESSVFFKKSFPPATKRTHTPSPLTDAVDSTGDTTEIEEKAREEILKRITKGLGYTPGDIAHFKQPPPLPIKEETRPHHHAPEIDYSTADTIEIPTATEIATSSEEGIVTVQAHLTPPKAASVAAMILPPPVSDLVPDKMVKQLLDLATKKKTKLRLISIIINTKPKFLDDYIKATNFDYANTFEKFTTLIESLIKTIKYRKANDDDFLNYQRLIKALSTYLYEHGYLNLPLKSTNPAGIEDASKISKAFQQLKASLHKALCIIHHLPTKEMDFKKEAVPTVEEIRAKIVIRQFTQTNKISELLNFPCFLICASEERAASSDNTGHAASVLLFCVFTGI